jgi:hypothetical protein
MLRLTLERFEFQLDEKGYTQEKNRTDVLEFVIEPADFPEGGKKILLDVLRVAIGAD